MNESASGPGAAESQDRRIDYIELRAPELEPIKAFYAAVFGWQFTDYGPAYAAFADGRLTGGFALGAVEPGSTLIVIYVGDLEDAERRVLAAGGEIARPIFDFPGGRRFHFRDPAGNELAVWSE